MFSIVFIASLASLVSVLLNKLVSCSAPMSKSWLVDEFCKNMYTKCKKGSYCVDNYIIFLYIF